MIELRERAAAIVAELAAKLADPAAVATIAAAPQNADPTGPSWYSGGFSSGHPGITVFFAELAKTDRGYAKTAHRHLAASTTVNNQHSGLYGGLTGVAFAARAAMRRPDSYANLLAVADRHILDRTAELVKAERERRAAGRAGAAIGDYDVVNGLAGMVAYLLGNGAKEALCEALTCLVGLTEPVMVDGVRVPGWWVPLHASLGQEDSPRYARGHFNLGLAHGIPGPLAALALAWRAGVVVPGQEEAIVRIVDWLIRWQSSTGGWSNDVSLAEEVAGRADDGLDRMGWCYGTPGVANAVYLAGQAIGRADWCDRAAAALRNAVLRVLPSWAGTSDFSLCHGVSGVLRIMQRIAPDAPEVDRLAEMLVAGFETDAPFGYRYMVRHYAVGPDRPSFLEGAAGIGLTLHGYAAGVAEPPAWDAALLLG